MAQRKPKAKLQLRFKNAQAVRHVEDPIEQVLSAAARAGDTLFVSCDETAGVDRLTACDGHWGNHRHFPLGELVELPDGPEGKMDIEGSSATAAGSGSSVRTRSSATSRTSTATRRRRSRRWRTSTAIPTGISSGVFPWCSRTAAWPRSGAKASGARST